MNITLGKQYLFAACLYLGQVVVGYTMGWPAPVLANLQHPEQTTLEEALSDAEASWIVSVIFIGTIAGPYISGYLSNAIGRKPCMLLGGTTLLIGYIILALAKQFSVIIAGRLISGMGTGIVFISNLVYIGEMASTHIRGALLTLTGVSGSIGVLLAFSVGPFVSYSMICWIAVALAAAYLVLIFFLIPETPVYQVMAGKHEEARANLISLGRKDDIDEVIAKANEKPKSNIAQITEMVTVKINRRALFIILVLVILQQMSGVVAILAFVTVIFDLTGFILESHISTIIIGVAQLFAACIAPLVVDRIGRKSLMLFSTAGCSLSLVALGTYFYLDKIDHPAAMSIHWLSLVSLMSFCLFYYAGFGIVPNILTGEMFTDNVRSFGSTFTITIGWLFGFGVTTAYGYMVPAWGADVTFWIYAGACAISFFFTIVFLPETKGKSLLEVQEMLSK